MSGQHPALPEGDKVDLDLLLSIHPHKREEYNPLQVFHLSEYSVEQHAAMNTGTAVVPEPSAMLGMLCGVLVFAKRLVKRRV